MFEVLSPCKINLFLYVLGKRADGFHDLQSLFCLLNYGDTMRFEVKDDGQGLIELANDMGFPFEQNLIYKAAKLLHVHTGKQFSVRVEVDKRLPMGGGLGGGSSNAATTLLVLNHLANLGINKEELTSLGAQLGSDVPFFVGGHNAFVEGRGEFLQPLDLKEQYYLVVTPKCHVSTKDVFTDPLLKEHYSSKKELSELLAAPYANDCVAVVRKKFCEIGHTLDRLVKYGHAAMSGTGASCFVACESFEQAQSALEDLKQAMNCEYSAFIACSTNVSPVIQALSSSIKQ